MRTAIAFVAGIFGLAMLFALALMAAGWIGTPIACWLWSSTC